MTEAEQDATDYNEARQALADARFARVRTDAVVNSVRRSSREIATIVQRNGYTERFRQLFREAAS